MHVGAGTHVATQLPLPEKAIQISCSDTYSVVITQTNRVFIMGRVPDPSKINGAIYSVNIKEPTELQFPELITKSISGPNFSIFYGRTYYTMHLFVKSLALPMVMDSTIVTN